METCGYVAVRNPAAEHNRWRYRVSKQGTNGTMHQQFEVQIYARVELSGGAQISAAKALVQKLQGVSFK
jgi:hypothetical protein